VKSAYWLSLKAEIRQMHTQRLCGTAFFKCQTTQPVTCRRVLQISQMHQACCNQLLHGRNMQQLLPRYLGWKSYMPPCFHTFVSRFARVWQLTWKHLTLKGSQIQTVLSIHTDSFQTEEKKKQNTHHIASRVLCTHASLALSLDPTNHMHKPSASRSRSIFFRD